MRRTWLPACRIFAGKLRAPITRPSPNRWCRSGLADHILEPLGELDTKFVRSERPNLVWPCDFAQDRTCDGCACFVFNILDEFTRGSLMIRVMAFAESQSTGLNAATT